MDFYKLQEVGNKLIFKYKKELNAVMTIEMSFIMPLVLACLVIIIFSGFCLHDKCVINKACMSAALRGSEEIKDSEAKERAIEAYEEVIDGKLLAKWTLSPVFEIGVDSVVVRCEGSMSMCDGIISMILDKMGVDYCFTTKACRVSEYKYIREKRKSGVGYCI